MAQLKAGDNVTCDGLRGYWRVVSIHLHPYSHSTIEVYQALIEPLGERWVRDQQSVALHRLHAVPVDLEDFR